MGIKLGVNIDHVATLRQARREVDPDPVVAARVARSAGADLIVTHLRQDRRHIQEKDILELRKVYKSGLHLELSAAPQMIAVGIKAKPDSVCIVPETPDEVTTTGGLNLKNGNVKALGQTIKRLKRAGIEVSLFIDPDAVSVRMAKNLGADAVELCTAQYAKTVGKHLQRTELERIELACYLAHELGMQIHAGHGLDYHNVTPIANIPNMKCLNIGFSIVARSVFTGLKNAVAEMRKLIDAAR